MGLPINIDELVHGNTIEWERLEFKKNWNPQEVINTICAFANDLSNWSGGYIIIGFEENQGRPIFPPVGHSINEIDRMQKRIVEIGYQIQPNYFPIAQPYLIDGKYILILWCPAGDNRPYSSPSKLGDKIARREYYVRVGSNSIVAKGDTLRRLQQLTARIPFDDRVNNLSKIDDLDLGLIQSYLKEVKSSLLEESVRMTFADLCNAMKLLSGSSENKRPLNVGLLFFCYTPEKFIERCWIEVVWHFDSTGSNFKELYFRGPIQKQIRDVLSFFKSNIIAENVIKIDGRAESVRYYNYPFNAVEEVIVNAVYHKSYELEIPIEIQIWPDKIEVLSFPGPVPPVNADILKTSERIISRDYRNRRIGDFLKELRLTEGRGTGIPTVYKSMRQNENEKPLFITENSCTSFLVILSANMKSSNGASNALSNALSNEVKNDHKAMNMNEIKTQKLDSSNGLSNGVSNGVSNGAQKNQLIFKNDENPYVIQILTLLMIPKSRMEIFNAINLTNQSKNRKKYLDPLVDFGLVSKIHKELLNHPNQKYETTEIGKQYLSSLIKGKQS